MLEIWADVNVSMRLHIRGGCWRHWRGRRRASRGVEGYVSIPLWRPLSVDIYQMQREVGPKQHSGRAAFFSTSHRGPQRHSVPSKPPLMSSLPFTRNTKFVYDRSLKIPSRRTRLQETVAVRKKIQDLCSRITALETIFGTPTNDAPEKERRDGLLQYVIIPPSDPVFNSFQEVRGHRETTADFV